MYQSVPSVTIPPGKFSKIAKSRCPGQIFWSIPGDQASLGPFILINFTLFQHFKTSVTNLPIEYVQIRRENIDLSMKNM